jgi:hypothetical protein
MVATAFNSELPKARGTFHNTWAGKTALLQFFLGQGQAYLMGSLQLMSCPTVVSDDIDAHGGSSNIAKSFDSERYKKSCIKSLRARTSILLTT